MPIVSYGVAVCSGRVQTTAPLVGSGGPGDSLAREASSSSATGIPERSSADNWARNCSASTRLDRRTITRPCRAPVYTSAPVPKTVAGMSPTRSCAATNSASTVASVTSSTTSSPGRKGEVGSWCPVLRRAAVRVGSESTSETPQSAHTSNPSRYSARHFGHHLVDMTRCYDRGAAPQRAVSWLPIGSYGGSDAEGTEDAIRASGEMMAAWRAG
jgi:hypothetical protein